MTRPRPAGLPWMREEDQLRAMLEAGMKTPAIALKLKTDSVSGSYAKKAKGK